MVPQSAPLVKYSLYRQDQMYLLVQNAIHCTYHCYQTNIHQFQLNECGEDCTGI